MKNEFFTEKVALSLIQSARELLNKKRAAAVMSQRRENLAIALIIVTAAFVLGCLVFKSNGTEWQQKQSQAQALYVINQTGIEYVR